MTETMTSRSLAGTAQRLVTISGRGRRLRPYALGELLIIVVLVRVYDRIKELAESRPAVGIHNADGVRSVERTLHLGFELSVNGWFASHHFLSLVASYCYQFGHEGITLSVLVACWWLRPQGYRAARNALVAINVVGLTVFALLPVAPPRLLPGGGFADLVANAGFGTTHGGPVSADQFAAMPSLHLAWATWTAFVLYRWWHRPLLRLLAVVYPILIGVVVVGTGNHYVLDVAAGIAVAVVCLALTAWTGNQVQLRGRRSDHDPGHAALQQDLETLPGVLVPRLGEGLTATDPGVRRPGEHQAPSPSVRLHVRDDRGRDADRQLARSAHLADLLRALLGRYVDRHALAPAARSTNASWPARMSTCSSVAPPSSSIVHATELASWTSSPEAPLCGPDETSCR